MNGGKETRTEWDGRPRASMSAAVRMRCPECRHGILYDEAKGMHRRCPRCGITFEREPGYFTGAIWISILLATPIALAFMFLFVWFIPDLHPAVSGILASLSYIPLIPLTIRISRSLWMYFDHQMHPQRGRTDPPGPGERPPRTPRTTPTPTYGRSAFESGLDDVTTSTGETYGEIATRHQ